MAEEVAGNIPQETTGTERPAVTVKPPPSWLQLGVLVADGSESMTWQLGRTDESIEGDVSRTKAEAVNSATLGFLDRMEAGDKVDQFSLGWVSFHDIVSHEIAPREVSGLRSESSFDPTSHGIGGTQIAKGLEAAERMIKDWRANPRWSGLPMSAVVVLLTDGEDHGPDETRKVAARLKELPNVDLAAAFFATKGQTSTGPDFLRSIVSSPEGRFFKQVYSAEALRDFFHASVTAVQFEA